MPKSEPKNRRASLFVTSATDFRAAGQLLKGTVPREKKLRITFSIQCKIIVHAHCAMCNRVGRCFKFSLILTCFMFARLFTNKSSCLGRKATLESPLKFVFSNKKKYFVHVKIIFAKFVIFALVLGLKFFLNYLHTCTKIIKS